MRFLIDFGLQCLESLFCVEGMYYTEPLEHTECNLVRVQLLPGLVLPANSFCSFALDQDVQDVTAPLSISERWRCM